MRHGKKINHLGRKSQHRKSMLANMAVSLIKSKRINTTLPKAKALRKYIEPILTRAKEDSLHTRRIIFSTLQDKIALTELFGGIAEKIANRNGGYTRILKTGYRSGDNAETCMIELVDYNENMLIISTKKTISEKKRTRRGNTKTSNKIQEEKKENLSTEIPSEPEVNTGETTSQ